MLYPREDKSRHVLLFSCRNCEHQEEADTSVVYQNNVVPQPMYQRGYFNHLFV